MKHSNLNHDPLKQKIRSIAISMFADEFKENMKGGTIEGFRRTYPTLYDKVIIPLMEFYITEIDRQQKLIEVKNRDLMNQSAQIDIITSERDQLLDLFKT